MRTKRIALTTFLFSVTALVSASCVGGPSTGFEQTTSGGGLSPIAQHPTVDLCRKVRAGGARCLAKMRTDLMATTTPQGFGPTDLISAYALPASGFGSVELGI